ncbi:glycosyl transferase, group 1 [Acidothermus cellulolyticus 11B]|uniref:Glycosyl transferase, group 1 n=1 Tax=Acidothermus cellulolyticus (strain ATCC 43068 / DSM 8971 / 11B) TaxID=351607 RepID=A0LR55_ACIC1|nr:glycosyl transferase, group 1 [Acidothermus cellulolyticus 11B]MBX5447576.1 glycosyltransferase family 4 protein [Acidothermus cellulolyticus]MCL6549606.1 glycosyltransferase family 4 protein [Acidothermus cellulolyticus]
MSAVVSAVRPAEPVQPARRSLHIAMVAPPYFHIPPSGYGGVEQVVADLVDGLVERGHQVTLIAAGEARTKATRFIPTFPEPLSDQLGLPTPEVLHAARVARALEGLDVDLVHDHTLAGPLLARGRLAPTIVTVHGPVSGDLGVLYEALGDTIKLVGISEAQRAAAPALPWVGTVYNAIRVETFPFRAEKENFALFIGRFHPEKAPHLAIDAARAAGLPIVLAGKCAEPIEKAYFEEYVRPRLGPDVTLYGVADAHAKRELFSAACCLLFPICWEEPFGLVMIEAMACGTPVVALRRGSVPEIVVDGRTGVVVDTPEELPDAIHRARRLDPRDCRAHVEHEFSVARMAAGYEAVYERVLSAIAEPSADGQLHLSAGTA